jgi:hypothetical protein
LKTNDISCIKIYGLSKNINKEMLEMFFESEERQGVGKVKQIDIDENNSCTTIAFADKRGIVSCI